MAITKTVNVETTNAHASTTLTDTTPTVPLPDMPQGLMVIGPQVTLHFVEGEWNQANSYDYYDVVQVDGTSYIAVQDVPANTDITNTEYWAKWNDPNAQMELLQQTVGQFDGRITENTTAINTLKKYATFTTPEYYGAIGDGITDDTEAVANAFKSGLPIIASNKYKITSIITCETPVIYGGEFIIDDSFTENSDKAVFSVDSENVSFYNVRFNYNITSEKENVYIILLLKNTVGSTIANCTFYAPSTNINKVCCIDAWGNNSYLSIERNLFNILGNNSTGGVFIRNISQNTVCKNIRVCNNFFNYKSNDEVLAVYSYIYAMQDVIIDGNIFYNPNQSNNLVSIGANDSSVSGGSEQASFVDCIISNCIFKSGPSRALNIGMSANQTGAFKGIVVSNCIFDEFTSHIGLQGATDVHVSGCKFYGNNTTGISVKNGDNYVIDNCTFNGNFSTIANGGVHINNNVNVTSGSYYAPRALLSNNVISSGDNYSMVNITANTKKICGNTFECSGVANVAQISESTDIIIANNYMNINTEGYIVNGNIKLTNDSVIANNVYTGMSEKTSGIGSSVIVSQNVKAGS